MLDDDEFARRLRALRVQYLESLDERVGPIRRLVEPGGFDDRDVRDDARRAAHGIAGTAESFGFAALGLAARALEKALDDLVAPFGLRDQADRLAIEGLAIEVVAAAETIRASLPQPEPDER